ncbi:MULTISPECIES: DM9 repeat-containing protein [Pseudoalteromonas]|uniref:Uncharacterized protein n=1 Tax=Pseudoalteromonas amylolytica TaxID=1859457 RepID=A0A1S1MYW8_9GAMM|nr:MULTISPECIES: DM9 repeat-containing protein [Pseudoalteromonas]OHU85435.1 hypothetical protein BFC16_18980 [Pseudoalteromonas sp. JW3]OHU92944.1 hypothetical protein BET10_02735 [Pseudoalteromonas amylolytica]
MKRVLTVAALTASFLSIQANAAVFGSYVKINQSEYRNHVFRVETTPKAIKDFDSSRLQYSHFQDSEYGNLNSNYSAMADGLCVDATSRKVPGVIKGGYCYVEHNGKNWKNGDYYYLASGNYEWRKIGNGYTLRGDEVTAGGTDSGEYSYHCIAEGVDGDSYKRFRVVGKYIPNHDTCYVGLGTNKGHTRAVHIGHSTGVPSYYPWAAKYTHAWILVAR